MKNVVSILILALIMSMNASGQTVKKELRHVVLFGWKATADSTAVNAAVNAFKMLPTQIKTIKKFEWGVNNSPEKINQGLTHCFFATFGSEKDRDDYLVHPDHKAFTVIAGPHIDKVTVVDYWVEK